MPEKKEVAVHWFRRDLRVHDNKALTAALKSGLPVLPVFIFDIEILSGLESNDDARVSFIYDALKKINVELKSFNSSLLIKQGKPIDVWKEILDEFSVREIYFNHDYEPYAMKRDEEIQKLAQSKNATVFTYKDQVIFEKDEISKPDGSPYTIFTPYMKKWFEKISEVDYRTNDTVRNRKNFLECNFDFPAFTQTGLKRSSLFVPAFKLNLKNIKHYAELRNDPAAGSTSGASVHLRFGTISIRELVRKTIHISQPYATELAWREFFMQILFHFPQVVNGNFKKRYDGIRWRNNEHEFELWCKGMTGYPLVDAGMRELNATGFMHNRIRMITAGFLCKHLLIDWRWGEAYFASKLLDYELSSNNGNWQWSAGTGCDAAPYFRIFNPHTQSQRFDPENRYTKKWVPEFESPGYPKEIVEHGLARERALKAYRAALKSH